MRFLCLLSLSLFFYSYCEAYDISVGRNCGKKSFNIYCEKDFAVYSDKIGKSYVFSKNKEYACKLSDNGIFIAGKRLGAAARVVHMRGGVKINGNYYRGEIKLIKGKSGNIMLVEKIDIEKYLFGVLRAEMGAGWPLESYKAQAVIARTYALKNIDSHTAEGYNVCSDVHCQVYRPSEEVDAVIFEAVSSTVGEIVKYGDKPAGTFFHSCCGGTAADVSKVWGSSEHPYLRKVNCPYCKESPHYKWQKLIPNSKITAALCSMGYDVKGKKLLDINLSGVDSSGRAGSLNFIFKGKKVDAKSAAFRLAVGPELLRSTKIKKIHKEKEGFIFTGNGWGHGVGLCQWGARGMANDGYGYRAIIKKYYPGTKIGQMR